MGTLVICAKTKCMYSKKRKDGACQCGCTAMGVILEGKCDSFMEWPPNQEVATEAKNSTGVQLPFCEKCKAWVGTSHDCPTEL